MFLVQYLFLEHNLSEALGAKLDHVTIRGRMVAGT